MHSSILSIFILAILCLTNSSLAETLTRVEISGNKKTTNEAIIQHGQIKLGSEISKKDLENIKENLGRINQIRLKKFEFHDGILFIEIEDKWTLFPVPMITQSGKYKNRGLLFYEDNFLGTLGTIAPGISWSNSVLNYLLYFQNESLFAPDKGIKFLIMKKSDYVDFTREKITVNNHESRYNSFLISPNILYKEHVFKAGPIYIEKFIYQNDLLLERVKSGGIFFRHHWNAFQILDIQYEGLVTTYDLYFLRSNYKKNIIQNEVNLSWSIPHDRNFINFGLHGYFSNESNYLFSKNLGGDEGFRGYDKSSLPTSQNIGFLFQYQKHLYRQFFLTPFYEINSSVLIDPVLSGKRLTENAIGLGLRYYFKKISIPAIMLEAARNIEDRSTHFHINIGVSI